MSGASMALATSELTLALPTESVAASSPTVGSVPAAEVAVASDGARCGDLTLSSADPVNPFKSTFMVCLFPTFQLSHYASFPPAVVVRRIIGLRTRRPLRRDVEHRTLR